MTEKRDLRIRFQVVATSELGVPKSQERVRLGLLDGVVNVQVGDINLSVENPEHWGHFKLGDIFAVDFVHESKEEAQ